MVIVSVFELVVLTPAPLADTELVTLPVAPAPTFTAIVNGEYVPPLSAIAESLVQVTTCPAAEQLHPDPPESALLKVNAEFSVSVTVNGSLPPVGSPVEPVFPLLVMLTVIF
jgi:hypothetical protein